MSSTVAVVRARQDHLRGLHEWFAVAMALALLLFAAPVRAQDHRQDVQLGPFHATGEWDLKESTITGKGRIEAPWGGEIAITASYDDDRGTGKWSGKFSHPVLGDVAVASGAITNKALTFDHKINFGAGSVVFDMTLTPEGLSGEGQGTLKTGKVSFGKVALTLEKDGIVAASKAQVRLPGLSAPFAMELKFDKTRFVSATGTGKINLGPYSFSAAAEVAMGGSVSVTAQQSQNLAGIGETQMTLVYADGKLSATGTRTISLGQIAFDNTTLTLDKAGKVSLSKTASVDLPGLGTTQLTLNYANGRLSASGTRQVKLGNYAFDNTAIAVSSTGTITATKQASLNLPVIGATQMTLNYANGTFSATGSRTVNLGNVAFSNAAIAIDSAGAVSVSKTQSVNLPGIGSTDMTLTYSNGVLSASGSREIRLGSYGFSNVSISVDSTGAVSLSKDQSLSLPGIGATQMTLNYAGGKLSATGIRTVSLGRFGFDNTAIVIDSSGVVAAQKQQSVNIPGIGSTHMALAFVNGTFAASGVQTVRLGSYAFDQTTIEIDSSGHVAISKTQSQNLPVIGSTQLSLAYTDGVISASGSRTISLGRFAFDSTAIAVNSSGSVSASKTQNLDIPGIGTSQMSLSLSDDTLSASGSQDVNLGQLVFSSAAITLDSSGTVSVVKSQGFNLPGLGNTQLTLAYANGVVSASGTRSVNLGSFIFSDAAIAVDSTGKVTATKQQTVNIAGIGNVMLTLGYANGEVSANGTASIGVSFLGRSINFGSAAVHLSSAGEVSVSASQGVNIGPVHYNVSISYENGSIHVHY